MEDETVTAFNKAWEFIKKEANPEEAWDSTCSKCNFNYYNEDGEGPVGAYDGSDRHGEHGWINEDEFDIEMNEVAPDMEEGDPEEGEDWYQFHNWLQERMKNKDWDVICGVCRDGLQDDWNATRRKWA